MGERSALPMPLAYSATFVCLPIVKRLDCFEVAVHVSRFVLLVTFCARLLSLSLKDQLIGRWLSKILLEICTLTSGAWTRSPADRGPPLARSQQNLIMCFLFFPATPARRQTVPWSTFVAMYTGRRRRRIQHNVCGQFTAMFPQATVLSPPQPSCSEFARSIDDGRTSGGFFEGDRRSILLVW